MRRRDDPRLVRLACPCRTPIFPPNRHARHGRRSPASLGVCRAVLAHLAARGQRDRPDATNANVSDMRGPRGIHGSKRLILPCPCCIAGLEDIKWALPLGCDPERSDADAQMARRPAGNRFGNRSATRAPRTLISKTASWHRPAVGVFGVLLRRQPISENGISPTETSRRVRTVWMVS